MGETHHDQARVYNELKAMVMTYRFRPGEQLPISELAERLGVSSTPIREALIRLQAESLLEPMPRRGFFARTLSTKEMIDLYSCGVMILKQALLDGKHAVEAPILEIFYPSVLAKAPALAANDTETVDEGRVRQCSDHVEQAYQMIASISRNDVMVSTIRNFIDRTHYVRLIDLETPKRFNCAVCTISDVAIALQSRDIDRAIVTLDRGFRLKIEWMPTITKEGVRRAYGLAE